MDKLDGLKSREIGQSAAKPRTEERSTTIPEGSRGNPKQAVYQELVIYQIKNKINNKIYIGSATYYSKRKGTHISRLRRGIHDNPHLQAAWNKYGEQNFEFSILEEVSIQTLLLQREQYYLDLFQSYNQGYNISKIAGSNLGNKLSQEAKEKIGNFWRGKLKTKRHIEKMKNSQTLLYGKSVICFKGDLQVAEYPSISEASRQTGISIAGISKQCSKLKIGRKLTFRYKDIVCSA